MTCEAVRRWQEAFYAEVREWWREAREGIKAAPNDAGFIPAPLWGPLPELVTACRPLCAEAADLLAHPCHQGIRVIYRPVVPGCPGFQGTGGHRREGLDIDGSLQP